MDVARVWRRVREALGGGREAAPRVTRERSAPAHHYRVLTMDSLEQLVRDDYAANGRKSSFKIRPAFKHLRSHFGNVFLIDEESGRLLCLKEGGHESEETRGSAVDQAERPGAGSASVEAARKVPPAR